jgi:hypothetical protein
MKASKVDSESLKSVRWAAQMIVSGSDEYARLETMDNQQLGVLASEHEAAAMAARHHLRNRIARLNRNN